MPKSGLVEDRTSMINDFTPSTPSRFRNNLRSYAGRRGIGEGEVRGMTDTGRDRKTVPTTGRLFGHMVNQGNLWSPDDTPTVI